MSLETTPCKLDGMWCLFTDQSWDCAGGDWQIITGDGEPVAWMFTWNNDGLLRVGGDIEGIEHYRWDDPEVQEFKASLRLKYDDILRIWCDLRVDRDGSYRANSKVMEWDELLRDDGGNVNLITDWRQNSGATETGKQTTVSTVKMLGFDLAEPSSDAP